VRSQEKLGKSGKNVKRELGIIRGRSGPALVARGSTVGRCTNQCLWHERARLFGSGMYTQKRPASM